MLGYLFLLKWILLSVLQHWTIGPQLENDCWNVNNSYYKSRFQCTESSKSRLKRFLREHSNFYGHFFDIFHNIDVIYKEFEKSKLYKNKYDPPDFIPIIVQCTYLQTEWIFDANKKLFCQPSQKSKSDPGTQFEIEDTLRILGWKCDHSSIWKHFRAQNVYSLFWETWN